AGLDQGGGEDGERAALLEVAGGAEEPLRRVEGPGVDAAGHDPPGAGRGQVVGPGQPGDAVEDDADVPPVLDHALGALDGQLGHLDVLLGRPVEGRGDDLALGVAEPPPHVGHLFGPLVDEQHHELDLGVVRLDRPGDLLDDRGLARLGRRDDEAPLALPDRRDQVDDAGGHVARVVVRLQRQALVGEQRRQVLEPAAVAGLLGVEAVDLVDAHERRVLLVAQRRPAGPGHDVAPAQAELPDLLHRHVDVVLGGQVAVHPQEAVALLAQVEEALDLGGLAGELLGLRLVVLAPPAPPAPAAVARLRGLGGLGLRLLLLLAAGLWGLAGRGRGALLAVAAGPVAVACGGTAAGRGGRLGRAGVAAELELPLRRRLLLRLGRRGGRGRRGVVTGGLGPLDPGLRPSGLVLAALPAALGRRLARRLLAAPRGAAGPGPRRRGPPAGRLAGGLDAGELEDELDDLGLAGPRRRLGAEGLGDRDEL